MSEPSMSMFASRRDYDEAVARARAHFAEVRERMAPVPTEQLKRLWDAYDGSNAPLGFQGEDIHLELNARGEGHYCAV